jgi:uncharacterized phage protein (TIGR01671 family)
MTREIKFRAWDKEGKKMSLQPFTLEDIFHGGGDTYAKQLWERNNRLVFMQFTGLLDKNGVEIYEGDILLQKKKYPWRKELEKLTGLYVEWNQNLVSFELIKGHSDEALVVPFDADDAKLFEIVGNIYQNSELLK